MLKFIYFIVIVLSLIFLNFFPEFYYFLIHFKVYLQKNYYFYYFVYLSRITQQIYQLFMNFDLNE